ncbi:hypothetical protein [Streptomyces tendae]
MLRGRPVQRLCQRGDGARVEGAAGADTPNARIRDIAAHCRLTERAVQRIIADLEQDGSLTVASPLSPLVRDEKTP